ncbi:cyclophilin-like domain-containing protein [Kockovaella imperatae]|uniref:peptidylprolyl isomerase n=1 Tax=Kockovaella imperatae TaxID=4999 RepID=A0A1Y1U9Y3_9TREE|nr:cyclophilin-like domain-containing protein [Kockovaella imperatae]ORX34838.1 cyclophilin-like domain-containing protein [Kockovaella imperatae]
MTSAPLPRTFIDFEVGGEPKGRVVFELFADRVPKTAENFRALCTGEKGISPISNVPLHYKNSIVHRVIDEFMIQAGDFTKRNGSGGESIYGGMFADERLEGEGCQVDKAGLLVMANRGPNTNGSQWFVTLAPAPHLTGKHVVFGRVIHGFEIIEAIGKLATDDRDRPLSPVTIIHCGELELRKAPAKKLRTTSPTSSVERSPPRRRAASRSVSPPRRAIRSPQSDGERRERAHIDSEEDSEREERRRRRERKRREKEDRRESRKERKRAGREETEAELDARLEREEKEQLEKARLAKLEAMKKQIEEDRQRAQDSGEVVYKGRGAMRYLDPESAMAKRMPTNYDSRTPDIRARHPPRGFGGPRGGVNGSGPGEGGRWERGMDVRPNFAAEGERFRRGSERGDRASERDRQDRELDRYKVKGRSGTGDDIGREGRKRDWDDWRSGRGAMYGEGRRVDEQRRSSRSRTRSRSASPRRASLDHRSPSPKMRAESPLRGDKSDASGSDMVMEDDD